MKKRIVTLVLAIVMVMAVLAATGCSDNDNEVTADVKGSSIKAMTLTLYTIKGEGTSQKTIEAVQDALNEVTESKLNTHVVLRAYTEDEYYKVIDEKIDAIDAKQRYDAKVADAIKKANKAAKSVGFTTAPVVEVTQSETGAETDETVYNELGLKETVYPEATEDQLDIFLITSGEKYFDYYKRGVLLPLDESLSSENKILKDIIYPTFLSGAMINGSLYAIPNNHMVGEYEYLLLNKKLFDQLYLDPNSVESLVDLEEYVNFCAKKGVTPIVDTYGVESFVYYPLGKDYFLSGYAAGGTSKGDVSEIKALYDIRAYRNTFSLFSEWQSNGFISTDSKKIDKLTCGAAFVKGDISFMEEMADNKDYYVVPYKNPTFTNEEVYSAMYAVGSYTKNLTRSMQVIALFNSNEQFINTLVYGAEGVNYEVDKYTGLVRKLNDDYNFNPLYAGNQFKIWQSEDMDETELKFSADKWALAKKQNSDSQSSPFLGFVYDSNPTIDYELLEDMELNPDNYLPGDVLLEKIKELTVKTEKEIKAYVKGATYSYSYEEDGIVYEINQKVDTFDDYVEFIDLKITTNTYYKQLLDPVYPYSLAGQYNSWLEG